MTIDFPAIPTLNQTYVYAGVQWRWDGYKWEAYSSSTAITSVNAGHGLTGGGSAGAVYLALAVPVAVADGGTGSTTASGGLANLGGLPTTGGAVSGGIAVTGAVSAGSTMSAASYWSNGAKVLDYTGGYTHVFGGDGTTAIHASGDNFYDANTHHFRRKGDNYESMLHYASRVYDPLLLQTPGNNCRIIYLVNGVRQHSLGGESGGNFSLYDDSRGTWCWYVDTAGGFHINGGIAVSGAASIGGTTFTARCTFNDGFAIYGGTFYNPWSNGWLYFDGSLHCWDLKSSNGVQTPNLYVGGLRAYNNSNYFYFDNSIHVNAVYSRNDVTAASYVKAGEWGVIYTGFHGTNRFAFGVGGLLDIYSSGVYWYSCAVASDERIKRDIRAPEADALDVLNRLTLYSFDWKPLLPSEAPRPRFSIGVIGQRLQELIPESVIPGPTETPEGVTIPVPGMLHLDMGSLIAYAFRAIQQLSERDAALMARIEKLEAMLTGGRDDRLH